MFEVVKRFALIGLIVFGTSASAQQAPWERPRPENMTAEHERYANQAQEVRSRVGAANFGDDPNRGGNIWTWQRGRNYSTPVANMEGAELSRLMTGRYFVYHTGGSPHYNVWYMNPDGRTHFCVSNRNGSTREYILDRYVHRTGFGLSGVFHWDRLLERTPRPDMAEKYGWPMVGNGRTGQLAIYFWNRNAWVNEIGWVQADYAAGFAERCPNLPRVAQVNNNQRGATIQEIAQGARPVRGFRTAFESDPADPLTVEMLYWAHPPR